MLSKLKWDLSAITPHDFLEQILSRLPLDQFRALTIKRHAQTFIAICSTGELLSWLQTTIVLSCSKLFMYAC